MSMLKIISQIRRSKFRLLATIYFNIRFLPLKQAIKFPFLIFGKVYTKGCHKGCFTFNCKVKSGMIRLGYVNVPWHPITNKMSFHIMGKHIINGPVAFGEGTQIIVKPNAVLETGNCTWFHRNVLIICYKYIKVDDGSCVTWEDQIIDTNFHYMIKDGVINNNLSEDVVIGKNVWVGNRTTIMRGAHIPSRSIVASNSLVNKDFSESSDSVLIAGSPAKIVRTKIKRAQYIGHDSSGSIFMADEEIKSFFRDKQINEINIKDEEFCTYLKFQLV